MSAELSFKRTFGRTEAVGFLQKLEQKWDGVAADALRTVPAIVGCNSSEMQPGVCAEWTLIRNPAGGISEDAIRLVLDFAQEFNK